MMHMEDVEAPDETSLGLVTFADDYLKIDETRFDRVETDYEFYCGLISLADIEDYENSPC